MQKIFEEPQISNRKWQKIGCKVPHENRM